MEDILSKSLGNNNKLTNSQASILALLKLQEIPWIKKKEPVKSAPEKQAAAKQEAPEKTPKQAAAKQEAPGKTTKKQEPSEKANTPTAQPKKEESKQ